MRTHETIAVLAVLIGLAGPAAGITVELAGQPDDATPAFGHCLAGVRIVNDSDNAIRGVTLRWRQGGPSYRLQGVIPPGGEDTLPVHLPAISAQQTFDLHLYRDGDFADPLPETFQASIAWPSAMTAPDLFRPPADLACLEGSELAWSRAARGKMFFAAAALAIAMCFLLMIPAGHLRAVALIVLAAGSCAVVYWLLPPADPLERQWSEDPIVYAVGARRTRIANDLPHNAVPIYLTRSQQRDDRSWYTPEGRLMLHLPAGRWRYVRIPAAMPTTPSE